jgi:endoplasmic reticulum-Golgi intermediate compartment protein 3
MQFLEMKNDLERVSQIGQEGYCGSCYGGLEPEGGCCQTCEQVRKAYLDRGWAFSSPDAIEQCAKEGWVEKVNAQAKDGCRVEGKVRLKKVASSLIFSFGQSFQANTFRAQELVPYLKDGPVHDFGHRITSLKFESDDEYIPSRLNAANRVKARLGVDSNPMDKLNSRYLPSPVSLSLYQLRYFH